jgi:hypothetical protein
VDAQWAAGELSGLARAAAFGARPEAEVWAAAARGGDEQRWCAAVALGGAGRYAAAAGLLRGLITGPDPLFAALAGATLAAHRRQLGAHAAARRLDSAALARLSELGHPPDLARLSGLGHPPDLAGRSAPRPGSVPQAARGRPDSVATRPGAPAEPAGSDSAAPGSREPAGSPVDHPDVANEPVHSIDPPAGLSARTALDPDSIDLAGAWSDVLLGLAADAVGLGEVERARRTHAFAERVSARAEAAGWAPGWRPRVRACWIGAEIELSAGAAERALGWAERAAELARSAPSTRHRVKSALVLSAALVAADTTVGRRRAGELLREALTSSLGRGIFSLAWPSALLLADLTPDSAPKFDKIASDALTRCFVGSDAEMRCLAASSPWVPTHLVRSGEPTRTSGELAS